jgi:ribosomal protein S18 acetylase RimI-like enzyme
MIIGFKTVQPEDEAALFALYAAVRARELVMEDWTAALRDTILRQQFDAQRRGYRAQHPDAREMLILVDGRPGGWAVLDRSGAPWRLLDVAIGVERRREGIATRVLQTWQSEAAAEGRGIGLSVLRTNGAARALYDRLGFQVEGESETHWRMEWRP